MTSVCRRYCKKCKAYYKASRGTKEYFCPKCDGLTEIRCADKNTVVEKSSSGCLVDVLCRDNPRWSWSMGVNPEQVNDMIKEHPDRVYNEDGQLLIKNRQHKKIEMKRHGVSERS